MPFVRTRIEETKDRTLALYQLTVLMRNRIVRILKSRPQRWIDNRDPWPERLDSKTIKITPQRIPNAYNVAFAQGPKETLPYDKPTNIGYKRKTRPPQSHRLDLHWNSQHAITAHDTYFATCA